MTADLKPSFAGLDADSSLLELQQNEVEVFGMAALESQLAAGGGGRDRVGPGLEIVGHHSVVRATQLPHAVDDQPLGADTFDLRAHLSEQKAQVLDMWLAGRVEDLGAAVREHGR